MSNLPATPPQPTSIKHYAGVYLVTESGKVIGQVRDDRPSGQPCLGVFGGAAEGDEQPQVTAWRELCEETNITLPQKALVLFRQIENFKPGVAGYSFYARVSDSVVDALQVYEGAGWAYINGSDDLRLIALLRPTVAELFKLLNLKVGV